MKILIACEESQIVCTAFRNLGFEAYSCDILPTSGNHPEWHIQQARGVKCDPRPSPALLKLWLNSGGFI